MWSLREFLVFEELVKFFNIKIIKIIKKDNFFKELLVGREYKFMVNN